MGYIKEPPGVDFIVDPKPITKQERLRISEIIAHYKTTGRKLPAKKTSLRRRPKTASG
jgi:hypothetical protein